MKRPSRKGGNVLASNYLLGAFALFLIPVTAFGQAATDEEEIEEVVVTGSFIRNSQFTNASPVETITQEDLMYSGASNLG